MTAKISIIQLKIQCVLANNFNIFVDNMMLLPKYSNSIFTTFILFVQLLCIQIEGRCQASPKKDFVISAEGHYGFIISHRGSIVHLIKGHIGGGELTYLFRTDGKKSWQSIHGFPEIGVSAMHLYLANPSEIGNLDAIYPFVNLRLNKQRRKFKLNLRIGVGLAWMSKPYDRITNNKNNAIGSYINGYVNLRINTSFMLNRSWRLDSGIGLTHASNGAIKTPNLGLNMATINLGIGYVFGNKNLQMKKDTLASTDKLKKLRPSIVGIFGIKELEHPLGNKYFSYALIGNVYHPINRRNKFGAGAEFVYSNATRKSLESDSVSTVRIIDVMKIGAKVGYAYTLNRLSIPIDFGIYVYQNDKLSERFFHRIGFQYLITKHVLVNVTLYTHWAKADYFEWGMGYEF